MKTAQARHWRRHIRLPMMAVILGVLQACAVADRLVSPDVRLYETPVSSTNSHYDGELSSVRVLTLNVAHGRGESFHQLLQGSAATVENLDLISAMLRREQADVVALQEADGPSYWSGNFHHVDYLAGQAAYARAVQGLNVNGLGLAYGTALLSRFDLAQASVVTFNSERAMTPKGFVVSTIAWPGKPQMKVDVVSLHLDFSSAGLRRQQAQELVDFLRGRENPLVIMGDFNAEWLSGRSVVWFIADQLGLSAYQPAATGQGTFPYSDKRLDWILISGELEFRSYQVVSDALSDHRGVAAELGLNAHLRRNKVAVSGSIFD